VAHRLTYASDGMLYVASYGTIWRVNPALGGATVLATGGSNLTADAAGHLFVTVGSSVDRIDLRSGARTVAAGLAGMDGGVLGPLPGGLGAPRGLTTTPSGDLIIGGGGPETALLLATFSDPTGTPSP
jgi:hypothetical protein